MVFGGATLDEPVKEGQALKINGSAMLVQAGSREEALKVVESDIYTKSGVWDTSKVCEKDSTRRGYAAVLGGEGIGGLTRRADASVSVQICCPAAIVKGQMVVHSYGVYTWRIPTVGACPLAFSVSRAGQDVGYLRRCARFL